MQNNNYQLGEKKLELIKPILNNKKKEIASTHIRVKAKLADITGNDLLLLWGNGHSKRMVYDCFLHRIHLENKQESIYNFSQYIVKEKKHTNFMLEAYCLNSEINKKR